MGYFKSVPRLSLITLLITQAFISTPVFAAGFQINETSPGLEGDAFAGAGAANDDVSALFINPATLSTLQKGQAYLGATEIFPHIHMLDGEAMHTVNTPGIIPGASFTAPVLGVTHQHHVSKAAFVPDGYVGYRFNDRLVGGIAIVAPFGLTTKYFNDSVLRFGAVYSSVRTVDIVPSLAYAITDQFAVGAGFQAQYIKATFSNFNGAYTGDPAIDRFIASNGPTYLKGNNWGYGYTLGALYKPDLCTRLGVGFRSHISEKVDGHGEQITGPGPVVPAPSPDFSFNAETSVHARIQTPSILTFSAARDIQDWTVKTTVQVNFWESFKKLSINMPDAFATNSTIQTRWRDSVFAAVGADYRVNCALTARAGFAFDQTPTKHEFRDPRIPDSNRYWLTLGSTYAYNKHLAVDFSYAHLFTPTTHVNVTQAIGTNAITTQPLEVNQLAAKYKSSVDIVGLAIRYSL